MKQQLHLPHKEGQMELYLEMLVSKHAVKKSASTHSMQSRNVYIDFIFTDRSNSGNQTGAASAIHRRPNAVLPRDAGMQTFREDICRHLHSHFIPKKEPSRTNEVIRLEQRLLAASKGDDTSLPCFLVDSFHEFCWQAREIHRPMGVILLNPTKENMAIREGIVRALRWLNSQNQQWLFWVAETSSLNGRLVSSMFSVRNTEDSMLFLLPSTTWKPTLVKQLHDSNFTEIDIQDRLSEVLEKTCDALKVLSAQREREEQDHNFRQAQLQDLGNNESDPGKVERQDNEKKARKARLSDEPEDGVTIRIRTAKGTLSRRFKRGAHFQEVYDWAGTTESLPHCFTLHRGKHLVSHSETVSRDETLNLTEREETEMETYFHSKVSFKGNYFYREGALSQTLEDAETDAKEDEEDTIEEDEKNDGNNEGPDTSLERKKRKRKNNRTTAQRLKKKKEKEGNSKTDN